MKKRPLPSTLSAHLLEEAARFLGYPDRQRRDRHSARAVKLLDDKLRAIFEWRRTFAPPQAGDVHKVLGDTGLLDEFYSREILRAVPGMVDRTRRLASLTLAGLPEDDVLVYLHESAHCYILGLPQAAMALARAVVEAVVTKTVVQHGGKAMAAKEFRERLRYAVDKRLLSRQGESRADKVWLTASEALHRNPAAPETALTLFEAARSVAFELTRRSPAEGRVRA